MRERPDLPEEKISAYLWEACGLRITQVEFLPLGSDYGAAVFHVGTRKSASYFLKLRKGICDEIAVLVPRYLHGQGIRSIIPPLPTKDGRLWASLEDYTLILYPFIEGRNGFERPLSNGQWVDFGKALKDIHTLRLPAELQERVPDETYPSRWRDMARRFLALVEHSDFNEPLAAEMAAFMRGRRDEIRFLIERAEQLGSKLNTQSLEYVLCHSDIHAGNLLLAAGEAFYIVDWDQPILAPKECDLMFVGGGVGGVWNSEREEALFYQGYGETELHSIALTYYLYERIVQDIAAYGEQILLSFEGGSDREQGYREFTSLFSPGSVVDIACQTDRK